MGLKLGDLLVGNYMSKYPISVKPDVPFGTASEFMADSRFATLIVMEEEKAIPID